VSRPLLLPECAVLLHIGMYKTGTSAIQGALFRARPQLAIHGVLHAGRGAQPSNGVLALRGAKGVVGHAAPRIRQWERLVDQVAAAGDMRVIVSSEYFADVDVEIARRAVRELGGPRVHVVVTLRPLTKILPSQWQQYLRNRQSFTYEDWLAGIFKEPPYNRATSAFWGRHHHAVLVERWASIVGPANITVIVPDENDRTSLLRTFEELAGLPSGLLVAQPNNANRSLSLGEIELVRQLNIEFKRNGWSDELYLHVARQGFAARMQTKRAPHADEPRISTPQWALDRAAEIGAAAAEKLSTLGVRIVGDISTLGAPVVAQESDAAVRAEGYIAVEAAREAILGTMFSSGLISPDKFVESTTSRELIRIVRARMLRRGRVELDQKLQALHLRPRGDDNPRRRKEGPSKRRPLSGQRLSVLPRPRSRSTGDRP
jgi:hypothetical protein